MNNMDSTKGGLGVALAILGCILGLAGLWSGLTAKNSQADMRTKLGDLESQFTTISAENQNLAMKVQELGDQTRQALTDIAARLPAPKAKPDPKGTTETAGTPKSGDEGKTDAKPPVAEGDYQIKAGDTLEKIAKAHNTTIAALQKANPSLNPKKMKIGQTIKIR